MVDTPNTNPDTLVHWYVFAVATFQDKHDREPNSGEVYETASAVFRDKQDVYATIGRAYNDKDFLYREERDDKYHYGVNESGVEALWVLGVPTEGPRGESDDELGFDLSDLRIPAWVAEADVGHDPSAIPLKDSTSVETEASGGFESAKARRKFFATLDEEDERHEWEPGAGHSGEVTFEGEEELVDEVFGDDEEEEDELPPVEREGVIDRDVSDPEPEVPLASFDPDANGRSPRDDTEETSDTDPEVIGTVNFEPDWEWVGVQMAKLGYPAMARRAFNEELTPAEVYGPVLELIYQNRFNPDADLDLASGESGLTRHEVPVTIETVEAAKKAVGAA